MGILKKIKGLKKGEAGSGSEEGKKQRAGASSGRKQEVRKENAEKGKRTEEGKEKAAKEKKEKALRTAGNIPNSLRPVIVRPLFTEKSERMRAHNQYVFEVAPFANKIEVKRALEVLYNVHPVRVQMITVRGKVVRFGRRHGKRKNWKKAIVTVREGERIEV